MVGTMEVDKSPNRQASQQSFTPLLQLDPEPIDSPPILVDADIPVELSGGNPRDGFTDDGMDGSAVSIKAPSTGAPGLSASASLASAITTATGPGPIFYCSSPENPARLRLHLQLPD